MRYKFSTTLQTARSLIYIVRLTFRLDQRRSFADINNDTEDMQRRHRNVHTTRKDIVQHVSSFRIFGGHL